MLLREAVFREFFLNQVFTTEMSLYFLHITVMPAVLSCQKQRKFFLHFVKILVIEIVVIRTSVCLNGGSPNLKCISSCWYVAIV